MRSFCLLLGLFAVIQTAVSYGMLIFRRRNKSKRCDLFSRLGERRGILAVKVVK